MALNLHISRPGCAPGARSGGHLKDLHCQQVKDSACTPSCFRFTTKRNLISLPQFIISPHVCGETSQPVDSNKVYKDPADFKRLTAQCGFLTKAALGRLMLCVSCMCRSHILQAQKCSRSRGQRGAATTAVD